MSPSALWRLILLCLAGLALPAAAADRAGVLEMAAGSRAAEALYAQNVGADPSMAWAWPSALAALSPPVGREPEAFRRGLFGLYMLQLAGRPWPRDATVRSTIAAGQTLPPIENDGAARELWNRALREALQPVWPDAAPPLPDELSPVADRMQSFGPGMWARPGVTVWSLTLRNQGRVPLAVGDLVVHLRLPRAEPLVFDCSLPRGVARSIWQPDQAVDLVCWLKGSVDTGRPYWAAALQRLAARDASAIELRSTDLDNSAAVGRMLDTLGGASAAQLADFARRHADCQARGRCDAEAAKPVRADSRATAARGRDATPAARAGDTGSALPGRDRALWTLKLLVALAAYMAVARWIGEAVALGLLFGALAVASVVAGKGEGWVSVIIIPLMWMASLFATAAVHLAYRAYAWCFFRRRRA